MRHERSEPGCTNHDTSFSALARVEVLDENAGEWTQKKQQQQKKKEEEAVIPPQEKSLKRLLLY